MFSWWIQWQQLLNRLDLVLVVLWAPFWPYKECQISYYILMQNVIDTCTIYREIHCWYYNHNVEFELLLSALPNTYFPTSEVLLNYNSCKLRFFSKDLAIDDLAKFPGIKVSSDSVRWISLSNDSSSLSKCISNLSCIRSNFTNNFNWLASHESNFESQWQRVAWQGIACEPFHKRRW